MKIKILITTEGREGGEQYLTREIGEGEFLNIGEGGVREIAASMVHVFCRTVRAQVEPNA